MDGSRLARCVVLCVLFGSFPAQGLTPPFEAGRYLRFDASDRTVAYDTSSTGIDWPEDFTLETWVYVTKASPFGVIAGRVAPNRGQDPYHHAVLAFEDAGGLTPALVQSNGSPGSYRTARAAAPIALERWVHLAGVKQGAVLRLYVDGQLAGEGASAGATPGGAVASRFAVGGGAQAGSPVTACCFFSGLVRNVRLWGGALTGAQIRESAVSDAPGATAAPPLRHWRMDDGAGGRMAGGTPETGLLERVGPAFNLPLPQWTHAGQLSPRIEYRHNDVPLRSPEIGGLWPYRVGSETRFLATTMRHPPTIPETRLPLSALRIEGGRLVDRSGEDLVGSPEMVHPRDHAQLDANRDGRMDLFIADHGTDTDPFPGGISRLFIQQADGRMADETAQRLAGVEARFTHAVPSADIDGDGDVDLLLCAINFGAPSVRTTFLMNDGQGYFSKDQERLPPEFRSPYSNTCLSGRFADVDGDGDPDLVFGLWWAMAGSQTIAEPGRDGILLNDGAGRFSLAARDALPPRGFGRDSGESQTVAVDTGDVDGDGDVDVVASVTNRYSGYPDVRLWLNDGTGRFSDASDRLGRSPQKADTFIVWVRLLDFDGDGRLDLYVDNPASRDILLNRDGRFESIGAAVGMAAGSSCSGASFPVDVDADGALDLAMAVQEGSLARLCTAKLTAPLAAAIESPAFAMASGEGYAYRLGPGDALDRFFIDVPAAATALRVETSSARNVDLFLSKRPFASHPRIDAAPQRGAALASAVTPSGNEVLVVSGAALSPGRWYVTPVNADTATAPLTVKATITDSTVAPALAAGHFFNPSRSGHGVSYEYVAGQRVLIWYTYEQDGTPVWYYAQDAEPSPNRGAWSARLRRFHWSAVAGVSTSVPVGSVRVTELGKQAGVDRIVFSWNLNGEAGSETMERLGGTGCPTGFEGNNGMWFAPTLSGYGYTVTYFPNYEFMPVYLYDARGNPRWLSGEKGGFTAADSQIPLSQIEGFCPWCTRSPNPVYRPAGTMTRRFTGNRITGLALNAQLAAPLSGSWVQDRPVQLLTASSPCVVP